MPPRPLSPHLGVYKFMYTMSLSILHRMTGLTASVGFLLFVWWLMALATGHDAYEGAMQFLASPVGKLLLVGFTFAFVYHFCNGIRHLVWDTGHGLERAEARRSGAIVIVAAVLLTALVVWLGCRAFGLDAGVAPMEIGR
ncbi:MAG TPA: succinate dehydrogenase, cytochrome b556 subunit [Steroidobacteraceae bacterium]|nr:succinate dehydrogenase, cytochrome b556 subunit [Steroidobacteraceae bacterium]